MWRLSLFPLLTWERAPISSKVIDKNHKLAFVGKEKKKHKAKDVLVAHTLGDLLQALVVRSHDCGVVEKRSQARCCDRRRWGFGSKTGKGLLAIGEDGGGGRNAQRNTGKRATNLAAQLSGMRDITKTSKVVGVGREKKFKLDHRRWCGKMGEQKRRDEHCELFFFSLLPFSFPASAIFSICRGEIFDF